MATYEGLWRNKWLTAEAKSVADMIRLLTGAVAELTALKEAGLEFDLQGAPDDYVFYWTTDPALAARFSMEEQPEEEDDAEEEPLDPGVSSPPLQQ